MTADERTDLTGEANTFVRVQRIKERHEWDTLRDCPGVNGIGIGKLSTSKAVNDPTVPPVQAKKQSDSETDHMISIFVLSVSGMPERPLFLEGVPLRFHVSGPVRAL